MGHPMTVGERISRRWRGLRQAWLSLGLLTLRKVADVWYGLRSALVFALYRRDWVSAARCLRTVFDSPRPHARFPHKTFYKQLRNVQGARHDAATRRMLAVIFNAVAPPDKIIWVRPDDIIYKTRCDLHLYFNDILPGDWDLCIGAVDRTPKHRSVVQHFRDGVAWDRTELFTHIYVTRLARGAVIRGNRNLEELAGYYESHFERLYQSISEHGFRAEIDAHGRSRKVPHVHIGRDGSILFGNNGNHRLAMAKLLELERIPCCVRARHVEWQQVRDLVATHGPETCWSVVNPELATHPDLADLLGADRTT